MVSALEGVELVRVAMPMVRAFATSAGARREREILLVHVVADDGEGWGECVAPERPTYTAEHVDGAEQVLARELVPALLAHADSGVKGHHMAKAGLDVALADLTLRVEGRSLAQRLGVTAESVEG